MKKQLENANAIVFYRLVKAQRGHQFAGLYAVEKVYVRNDTIYKKEIVHEWDMRAFSEAALARLGGSTAYDAYVEDHSLQELPEGDKVVVKARTAEDLKGMTREQLEAELRLKLE